MKRYKLSRILVFTGILLLVSTSFLYFSFYKKKSQIFVFSNIVREIISPLDAIIAKPTQFFSDKKNTIQELFDLLEQNKELKKTLFSMEDTAAENDSLRRENESLRENLGISKQYFDKKMVHAFVSVRTPNAWNQELFLDIGEQDGVSESMLVVANGGVIGAIESVTDRSTRVTLLTNANQFTKLAVKIAAGSETVYGILTAYDTDSHSFVVSQLNSDVEIPEESLVVTSDLAGDIPSNLQLGKVRSVQTNLSSLNRELYVSPAADFSGIYSVTVIGNRE